MVSQRSSLETARLRVILFYNAPLNGVVFFLFNAQHIARPFSVWAYQLQVLIMFEKIIPRRHSKLWMVASCIIL